MGNIAVVKHYCMGNRCNCDSANASAPHNRENIRNMGTRISDEETASPSMANVNTGTTDVNVIRNVSMMWHDGRQPTARHITEFPVRATAKQISDTNPIPN